MNRIEFDVLCAILDNPKATQRQLAELTGASLGSVHAAHR